MAKAKTIFSCTACGSQFPKRTGQCQGCGDWNSLQDEAASQTSVSSTNPKAALFERFVPKASVHKRPKVSVKGTPRFTSGLNELGRVLGGGLAPCETIFFIVAYENIGFPQLETEIS